MEASLKKILRGISLELRHTLEGWHDKKTGAWNPGDLERRLNEIGAWGDRPSKPLDEMPHLSAEDKAARRLVDGYLQLRAEAGVERAAAVAEFVRESAYTWANRLFALRCMEARSIIEEVILQKAAYAGRSLVHQRHLRKSPDAAKGEDDGLFAVLFAEFAVRSQELPALFDPKSPAVALRPSVAALMRCVALLSGTETVRGQDPAADVVFTAPDAFGWAYQYWNAEEQKRVFEMVRTKKGAKIERADIVPATQFYTEPYMVKFLVQNSLGALWMGMYPDSKLCERWEYYVKDADRASVTRKPVREITFLDPAEGSGHFHLEAFDLFYAMYEEEAAHEGRTLTPREICAAILNQNLYGIDIDGRSVQIATAALWMKAKERTPELEASDLTSFHDHLVATNIRLPKGKDHLQLFLQKHPEDEPLRPALELVFQGLKHSDELGSLLQIEELVDAVLRRLKEESDKSKGVATQPGLFEKTLVQGTLAVSAEDFDKWKREALNRLQAHFESEAQTSDAVQAFFGDAAGKGLKFFDVLSGRYDVVVANPPYMGSKNMGDAVKAYVSSRYSEGKRDAYSAFILRNRSFCREGGVVAMITLQTWMFHSSFAELRDLILSRDRVQLISQLGRHAFSEADPPGNPVLFIFVPEASEPESEIVAYRLTASRPSEEQAELLAQAVATNGHSISSRVPQQNLADVPGKPFVYWLRPRFFQIISQEQSLAVYADVVQGLATGTNERFVRAFWETSFLDGWMPYRKGGGFSRWVGLETFTVDWRADAIVLRTNPRARFQNSNYYFGDGLTYSYICRGSLSARIMEGCVFDVASMGVFPKSKSFKLPLLGLLNTKLASWFLRSISQNLMFQAGTASKLPVAAAIPQSQALAQMSEFAILGKILWTSANLLEGRFSCPYSKAHVFNLALAALLHTVEAVAEKKTHEMYGLGQEETQSVFDEVGSPSGWFSLLAGYDEFPPGLTGLPQLPSEVRSFLDGHSRRLLPTAELAELKLNLRKLFEAGPGSSSNATEVETDVVAEESDEEDESLTVGSRLPIPAETFIEELSQKLEVHPISIYLLLAEGIEREGWHCPPEELRLTEDRFTVVVLRLLGHRWPKQLEDNEALPAWADQDGIIPLTGDGGETPLIERVRQRLEEGFPGGNVATLEREFEDIVGVPLGKWLAGPFFERHIGQFKKRPIAWQLETVANRQAAVPGGKGKKKRPVAGKPVFACLVYYHKLDVDLLPKIRTQYVGLLRGGFETEFRTLERLANPTGDQQARRLDLEQWTDELQAFDQVLEDVSLRGFGPETLRPALRQYGINDALLTLTATWLRCLSETVAKGPLGDWTEAATKAELHPDLPKWLRDSMSNLNHFCAVLGPKPPDEKSFATDPTSKELAPLVCHEAKSMVESSLKLGCDRWWKPLDAAVLEPLRQEIKVAKGEIEKIDEELEAEGLQFQRRNELGERKHELKVKIKSIKADHDEKSDRARKVRSQIEKWACPEAETWETWLSAKPLFDAVTSLDGQRPPPQSIADFITQESRYAPDINDGVRVNIAPIQKAGLLHADVLDSKDADKAIADRAEWRADERRWVREGKLPQPGWWKTNNTEVAPDAKLKHIL